MQGGQVFAFPSPWGLTEDDLVCLYRFVTGTRGGQIDILTGPSRRTSAILAVAGRHLRVERDGDALFVRDLTTGHASARDAASDDLHLGIEAALRCNDDDVVAVADDSGRW
jgi:hypothetical protein